MIDTATSIAPEASPWDAPSKLQAKPLDIAKAHQKAIRDSHLKAGTDAACVSQIMVGRYVRHRDTKTLFLVTEVRLSLGWVAHLYGRAKGQKVRRRNLIGGLDDVEIVNVGAEQ